MGVPGPVSQMWTVATYVLGRKAPRRAASAIPLVLMLEPLFRCNLALTARQNPIPRPHPQKAAYARTVL